MNIVKKFLLISSGADLGILQRPECRIEHNQYIGIGAAILSTSVLACISSGYALFTVFRSTSLSVLLGLFWGLTVFNLDRYFVSSIRKRRIPPNLPFQKRLTIKLSEVITALPRLILAIFISVIISRPIELRLFEGEINAQLDRTARSQVIEMQNRIKQEFPEIDRLNTQIEQLRQDVARKEEQKNNLYNLMMAEVVGRSNGSTTGKLGKGPVYRERQLAYNQAESEYQKLKENSDNQIASINQRLTVLRAEEDNRIKQSVAIIQGANGLLPRLEAYNQLTNASQAVALANIFLILLFLLLETAPILVKLLSSRGPYDEIYETLQGRTYSDNISHHSEGDSERDGNNDTQRDATHSPKAAEEQSTAVLHGPSSAQNSGRNTNWRKDPYRLVGTTFGGKYRLEKYAGGGGMGAVYYSFQINAKKWVAVKILKPDILERNLEYAVLFEREVKAAQRLEHPHIVKVLDAGNTSDEISFMVMEWLNGETLEKLLFNGPLLPINRISNIFAQVCDAVACAHGNNILHLDIKPANIFHLDNTGSDDYIKVIDFGMARILSSETGTTVTRFLGTYQYCSPEHFGGKVSHRSDIYSLGATLYHMLAGVLPFGASYINAKAHPHLELPPIPSLLNMRPGLRNSVDAVVQKALSKNPEHRQATVKQLLEEFRNAAL